MNYICTLCQNELTLVEKKAGSEYLCNHCKVQYPIIKQIPRFVPAENYADSFGYQWNIHDRTQLDSYTGLPISKSRVFSDTGWPESLKGQNILEAGSGAGRFTEILVRTGAEVVSFDYSNAVEANYRNNGKQINLQLFQGNIYNIPFKEQSFDKVLCLGVLQHTPNPEKAFMSLAKFVKPGGEIIIDIYRADFMAYLQWKYILRPITRKMEKKRLYKIISNTTPFLIPLASFLRKIGGRIGARIVPIVEYSHLQLSSEINKEWAILDTFDMYSPMHDHPQNISTVNKWFSSAGFIDIKITKGTNGIIGKGRKPK
jgi:2-polyprenyl-3-methyl-5-hydroxy-6-metoxy-1,4-benzoquinol methylase